MTSLLARRWRDVLLLGLMVCLARGAIPAAYPLTFVKMHRVGGTTMQNLLVRYAVNHNKTVLCTHLVSNFNSKSLVEFAEQAAAGKARTQCP